MGYRSKPRNNENACFCNYPACAVEIYDHEDYVHHEGDFYHVNCWWRQMKLPPCFINDQGKVFMADVSRETMEPAASKPGNDKPKAPLTEDDLPF